MSAAPRLLLFGGTFDPPHNGHMHFLKSAIEAVRPDRVVVMPAGLPPHKAASATPGPLRLAMCRCFEPLFDGLEVSDWELRRGGKSYTVDTVEMLGRTYPGWQIYLCVGSDMLLTFTQWRDWQRLLKRAVLVAQTRQPGDMPRLEQAARRLEQAGGRVLFTGAPALPMASSELRAGRAGPQALPETVRRIARENHLYGYGKEDADDL